MDNNTSLAATFDIDSADDGDADYRTAPHNIEAEQALLGAILVNNEACDRVSAFLKPEHFFDPLHARLYEAAAALIRAGRPASPVTLKTYFDNDEALEEIGGAPYLARLAASATTIINAEDYGRTIFDLATRRALIGIGEELVNDAYETLVDSDPKDNIERTEQALYDLAENGKYGQGFQNFGDALTQAVDMAAKAYERDGGLSGISCGLQDIDDKMGGLQQSDLIVLAGRPAMGKTALATNLAFHVARAYKASHASDGSLEVENGGVVAFFSLEMSSEQLATRIVSEQAGISSEKIRRGQINESEFHKLVQVSQELQSLPLYIDDTGGITVAQLAARARRLKRREGVGLIVVDYLQLLAGSAKTSSQGRVQEVTEITTKLKALAKELNCPIIALSQLSRQVEARDDKRPHLADLRESGSIEQDADVVLFIYREEYYKEKAMPRENTPEFFEWQEDMDKIKGLAEVIIAKQRHGPTGTIRLQFQAEFTRFQNYARSDHMPERFD